MSNPRRKARECSDDGCLSSSLVINLATANALGLTVPPSLLAIADEVIE